MKAWQKSWLIVGIAWSSLHLIRDISQDIGIKNWLSTPFVKSHTIAGPWFWYLLNTYVFEIAVLILSVAAFKQGTFHPYGTMSLFLTTVIFSAWLFYWFFL